MKRIICFCLSALLCAGAFFGCQSANKNSAPDSSGTIEETTEPSTSDEPIDNEGKQFLGKWESYKALVLGEVYETEYAGYPLSSVAKLEIFDDKTATMTAALNPRGKENSYQFAWSITNEGGEDILHMRNADDYYDLKIKQGQMLMTYADYDDGTIIYLMKINEFTKIESTTEAGLDKIDYSGFFGRWEAEEVKMDGELMTEKLGEYPINVAFRLEMFEDNNAVMSIIGDAQSYEWEAEKKDQLYMWRDYEGFAMRLEDGRLVLDNERDLYIKLKKVDEFTDFDFSSVYSDIPDEDIILNPEEEPTT